MDLFKNIPWPEDYINVETGDYITNIDKAKKILNWIPNTDFEKGISKTVKFYSKSIFQNICNKYFEYIFEIFKIFNPIQTLFKNLNKPLYD